MFGETKNGNISLLQAKFVTGSMIGKINVKDVKSRHDGIKDKIEQVLRDLTENEWLEVKWEDIELMQHVKVAAKERYKALTFRVQSIAKLFIQFYTTLKATDWTA